MYPLMIIFPATKTFAAFLLIYTSRVTFCRLIILTFETKGMVIM